MVSGTLIPPYNINTETRSRSKQIYAQENIHLQDHSTHTYTLPRDECFWNTLNSIRRDMRSGFQIFYP